MEDWATSEKSLNEQQKMFKEEMEDKMPEFYREEEEIISF